KTAVSVVLRHVAPLADPDSGGEALLSLIESQEPLLRGSGKDAMLDLVHAAGQLAADPGMDTLLSLASKLFTEKPELMARITGSLLDAKAALDAHPETLPEGSTLIDDSLDVLVKMGRVPGLLE